jgi:hypothetical protein
MFISIFYIALSNEKITFEEVQNEKLSFPDCFDTNEVNFGFPFKPKGVFKYSLPDKKIHHRYEAEEILLNEWQIPENILREISDKALVVTVLNNPFLMYSKCELSDTLICGPTSRVYTSSDIDFFISNFNGIAELKNRESIPKLLFKLYTKPSYRKTPKTYSGEVKYICKTRILTDLLFSDEFISKLSEKELIELFKVEASLWSFLNHNYRTEQENKSNLFYNNPNNLKKILEKLNYPAYMEICEKKVYSKDKIRFVPDKTKLINIYEKFVSEYRLGDFNPKLNVKFHKSMRN